MITLAKSSLWAWVVGYAVVIVFLIGQTDQQYPAVILAAFAFAFVQWRLPACRPVAHHWLCPWNWALAVFFLQLVILPAVITLDGPALGVLPHLPSSFAINMAIIINIIAFLSFSGTYSRLAGRGNDGTTDRLLERANGVGSVQGSSILWPAGTYLALGIIGVLLAFGSLSGVLEYFTNPTAFRSTEQEPATWPGFFSVLLRPFLGFAFLMVWCRRMDRVVSKPRLALLTAVILAAVILSYGTFGFNRGSFTVPVIAMAAVSSAKGERLSLAVTTVGVLLILGMAPALAAYRGGDFSSQELFASRSNRNVLLGKIDVMESIQMYGAAPQFLAFFLERNGWVAAPHWGSVVVSSLLSPVPVLGKLFRESSGTAIYNTMIYDTPEVQDQIAPFQGELFLDFNIVGVILGYCFLGWIAHKLQRAFERSRSSLDCFIWQYAAMWMFFLIFGSISVVSQIYFYFGWPIYLYFLFRRSKSRFAWGLARVPAQGKLAQSRI